MRLAILLGNLVENVVEAPEGWEPGNGRTTRTLTANEPCGPGWTFNGSTYDQPAAKVYTDREILGDLVIALALLTLDEINLLRTRIRTMDAAVASAGSLSALKTAWAALSNVPDRTRQQLLDAVKTKLSDGSII